MATKYLNIVRLKDPHFYAFRYYYKYVYKLYNNNILIKNKKKKLSKAYYTLMQIILVKDIGLILTIAIN